MRCDRGVVEEERLPGRPQELARLVREHGRRVVRGPTAVVHQPTVEIERVVEVLLLRHGVDRGPAVPTRRNVVVAVHGVVVQILPDESGGVPRPREPGRERVALVELRIARRPEVPDDVMVMGVLAGEHARTPGTALRGGDMELAEGDAVIRKEAVDVLHRRVRVVPLVVGDDHDDVQRLRGNPCVRGRDETGEDGKSRDTGQRSSGSQPDAAPSADDKQWPPSQREKSTSSRRARGSHASAPRWSP